MSEQDLYRWDSAKSLQSRLPDGAKLTLEVLDTQGTCLVLLACYCCSAMSGRNDNVKSALLLMCQQELLVESSYGEQVAALVLIQTLAMLKT